MSQGGGPLSPTPSRGAEGRGAGPRASTSPARAQAAQSRVFPRAPSAAALLRNPRVRCGWRGPATALKVTLVLGRDRDLCGQEPGEGAGGDLQAAGAEAEAGEGAAGGSAPVAEAGGRAGAGRAAAAERAGAGAAARAAEVRAARAAHAWGWCSWLWQRNWGVVWGHGARRKETPEALGCGQLGGVWNGDLLCSQTEGDVAGDVLSK